VPGRHMHALGKRLNIQRLGEIPVDAVAHATQPREVAKVLLIVCRASHTADRGSAVHPAQVPQLPCVRELPHGRQSIQLRQPPAKSRVDPFDELDPDLMLRFDFRSEPDQRLVMKHPISELSKSI
jgi:hypothetical protein